VFDNAPTAKLLLDCISFLFINFYKEVSVNKQELIEVISKKTGLSKRNVGMVTNEIIGEVTNQLTKGKKVVLAGFGTFMTNKRAARMGVNPQNPTEKIKIAAATVPKFRAGKTLKLSVRK